MNKQQEDAAIRQVVNERGAAWNNHEPKSMAAFFVPDGGLINPFGRHPRRTAEIEKLFTEEHAGPMAGTTYAGTVESIRYIGESVAIVDVAGEIRGMKEPDGAAAPPFKPHVTWITETPAGKWMAGSPRAFALVPAPTPAK